MKNSPTMDFQNRMLFPINTPEVSETELSKWRRAFTVFIWLLGFNFLFVLKSRPFSTEIANHTVSS